MSDGEAKCFECGVPVSCETGFTMTGGLGDNSLDRIWCPQHAPDQGRGYALSDLEKWREDSHVERAKYEMSLMEKVGPDVYFAIKGERKPSPARRLHDMQRRIAQTLDDLIGPL